MRHAAAALALALAALPASSQQADGPPLQVRKIVVYKHGVGYFEREGAVRDNQRVVLTFKSAQMKDLLKSLYAVDLDGGRISTVSYDTRDPLSKQLEDILIRVPEAHALTQFLTQLKGARVEVVVAGEATSGSVVGIEPVQKQADGGTTTTYKLVLFRDDGRIQPLNLLEVSSLKILDEGLQKDLQRLLEIALKAKYSDRKSVVLDAQGQGQRTVRVGYIIETPIWKTSYRLLFEDGQKPLLQGWAILENTTDEDWQAVDVSFVAGSPLSFVMDLYTAYYPQRPEIPVAMTAAPAGEALDRLADAKPGAPPAAAAPMEGRRMMENAKKEKAAGRGGELLRKSFAEELELAAPAAAEGMEVGELFAYRAREKVSVKRGQAALVPILSERVDGGDRVLFWREGVSGDRPLNAFYFRNSTGLTLEAGPVTIFDGSTCIGESLLRKVLKKDMREMLPYAVEAGATVARKVDHRNDPVVSGRIANGVLTLSYTRNLTTEYAIRSQLGRDATLYLDHAKTPGFSLAEPAKAEEEVEDHHRFRIELKGGATADLKVRETQPMTTTVALLQTPAETIRYYASQRYLSPAAQAFLEALGRTQGEINRLRQREAELAQERARIQEDDQRVRENLRVLRDTPQELELRRTYLARLQESDARLAKIREELKTAVDQRQGLERELAKKVSEFKD